MSENKSILAWAGVLLYLILINLVFMLMIIGGRLLFGWQPLSAYVPFFYGVKLCGVLAFLGLIQLLFGAVKKRKHHLKFGVLTIIFSLLPVFASVAVVGPSGFKAPRIHDITTDMEDPPAFSMINSLRASNDNSLEYAGKSIAEKQLKAYPDIQPLVFTMSPEEALMQAQRTVESLGWTIVNSDEKIWTIEAYETSTLFGFISDVVIRISPTDQGSRLDIRSVSRLAEGDLGKNARRILRFFQAFNEINH